jgi:hypothetical protein
VDWDLQAVRWIELFQPVFENPLPSEAFPEQDVPTQKGGQEGSHFGKIADLCTPRHWTRLCC